MSSRQSAWKTTRPRSQGSVQSVCCGHTLGTRHHQLPRGPGLRSPGSEGSQRPLTLEYLLLGLLSKASREALSPGSQKRGEQREGKEGTRAPWD